MRKARPIDDSFLELTGSNEQEDGRVTFFVDVQYEDRLYSLLERDDKLMKRFRENLDRIRIGKVTDDIYKRAKISQKTSNVYEIKLKQYRIFCKQINKPSNKIVIAVSHIMKKKQKFDKHTRELIERIGGYEYEFEE